MKKHCGFFVVTNKKFNRSLLKPVNRWVNLFVGGLFDFVDANILLIILESYDFIKFFCQLSDPPILPCF